MTIRPDRRHRARLEAVIASPSSSFVELVKIAGLDPKTAFRYGDLQRCDLRGEDLGGFNLMRADFTGANVAGTIFNGANLTDAKLAGAVGLEQAILDGAIFDAPATWPIPDWASAAGRDEYGTWADFTVPAAGGGHVTQRMRWIPDGEFLIGSPVDEDGRDDDEGPQKPIRIAEGFWLFDTPCTQALWLAVMGGENPSQFQSPDRDRPVETVDFNQVADFIRQLNEMKPGLALSLPSEARWEYACRAGTTGATYDGPMTIVADHAAPVLDPIAWYGGNCGQDFELDNGSDISGWSGKQYDDAKGGTHPVARKRPNQWGLYDMLGNVLEWCADKWHDSHKLTPGNGDPYRVARGKSAAGRVVRGGSWIGDARNVRAAFRNWHEPGDRYDYLGFRCARGHGVSPASDKPGESSRGKRGSGATGGRGGARPAPERAARS